MRELPPTSPSRHGVFTAREAHATGWTTTELKYAARQDGPLVRLRQTCFAPQPDPSITEHQAADLALVRASVAAFLCARGVAVSHLAGARLFDVPTWAAHPRACVTTDRDVNVRGVHTHQALDRPGHFALIGDVRVTVLERTIVDIAREFGPEAGLVVADAAAHRKLITLGDLDGATEQFGQHLDVDAARTVLDLVDPRAESPLESRSRWRMWRHDLPMPSTQVEILSAGGEFIGRTDFYWPEGVVGEVDGMSKYTSIDDLRREKWRQERLEELGLIVVRWGARDLADFGRVAERIRRALDRARARAGDRAWIAVPPQYA